MSCLSELETDVDNIGKTHISAERELHFHICLTKETVNEIKVNSSLEVKKLEIILKPKISAMIGCLPTRVGKSQVANHCTLF